MPNYPVPYQNSWNYNGAVGQQMYPQYQPAMQTPQMAQTMSGDHGIKWVDGEVGAKAYQMPVGWPANTPIALWDTNDTVIYLKSTNPMGMPNPLQKARYKLEEYQQVGKHNDESSYDTGEYVRKEELEHMKQELMDAINSANTSGTAPRKSTVKGE